MSVLNPKRPWPWLGIVAAMSVAAGFYGSFGGRAYAQNEAKAPLSNGHVARVEALSDAFKQAIHEVGPAVVQITSTEAPQASRRGSRDGSGSRQEINPEDIPEPFREFFKDFGGKNLPLPPPQPRIGSGSGVIIDAQKGLILTNNHVVGKNPGSKEEVSLRVKLPDGRRNIDAKVVGQDPKTDIALLQIIADNLHAAKLGDSGKMEVGDFVLAIGAPFGLEQTVTQGIVSAKGRSGFADVPYQDWIQTDAAINPGNSGGPLINIRGEVIGINVAIATSGLVAGYQGVGFAIPINTVKDILPDLREGREVVRGYLGVQIQGLEVQPGLAETFGLKPDQNGVLVEDVQPRTPAAKAGLKRQDVILSYDGHTVKNANELQGLVARTKPGTKVDTKVWRENKEITIPVTIEKQPENFFAQARTRRGERTPGGKDENESQETVESLGMTVEELTPELAKRYGLEDIEDTKNQVVVTQVEPLGEAAAVGLSPGDVITSVGDKTIKSPQGLQQALSGDALEHGLRMQVRTKAGYRTLYLKLSPAGKSK